MKSLHLLALTTMLALADVAHAQGTAFTYQGRLNDGGTPGSGVYDLRVTIYDAASGGNIRGLLTNSAVAVSDGLFTTTLDFGPGVFNGGPRWLEIGVRSNGIASAFTSLSPRQSVLPAPYAVFAGSAGGLAGTLPVTQLPASVVTNNAASLNLSGTFVGNGAGMTNVDAVSLGGIGSAGFWQTDGNAGGSPTNGAFLGTTDSSPLVFKVNGSRALRLEPATNLFYGVTPSVIAGSADNVVSNGLPGCVIAGGGTPIWPNRVGGAYSAVLGGLGNLASGDRSTAMGDRTTASGFSSTAIGVSTTASGEYSTSMGNLTRASGESSTSIGWNTEANGSASLAAGYGTIASGAFSVAMGANTLASGHYSTAMGQNAAATNRGTFVWADPSSSSTYFNSTGENQFLLRATGGVGINTNNPQATLDVNGSLRVGSAGTVINNLQAGQAIMPGSSTAATNFTITFPKAFTTTPKILVTVANDPAWQGVSDTFAVSVSIQSPTAFRVNVVRVDTPAAWSQQLRINWQAWQ